MHHTVVYHANHDPDGAFTELPAVKDPQMSRDGNAYNVPAYNYLLGAYACLGSLGADCRLRSPSIDNLNPLYLTGNSLQITPIMPKENFMRAAQPIMLSPDEALTVEENSNPAANERHSAVLFLGEGAITPVSGDIRTIRAQTESAALVVDAYNELSLSFPDRLPTGRYSVVGARVECADGVAFRFAPIGQAWRPGGLTVETEAVDDPWQFRNGGLGVWFEFTHRDIPSLEIWSSAAVGATVYNVYLDVIYSPAG